MNMFNQTELEKLKLEYLQCLKMVILYCSTLKKDHQTKNNLQCKTEIGLLNNITEDLWDSVYEMEKYLPANKQIYLFKKQRRSTRNPVMFTNNASRYTQNPETLICDLMIQKKLLDTLHRLLTPRQFEIVYLYYYQNINQAKIASELNLSKPTVTEHLQKALNKIRSSRQILGLFEVNAC